MSIKRNLLLVASASLIAAAAASPASAGSRRYPASACTMEGDYTNDYLFQQGIANQTGSRYRILHCPVLDSDAEKVNLSAIGINGYDGNHETTDGNVSVNACASHWNGTGLACSGWRDVTNGTAFPSATYTGLVNEWLPASLVNVIKGTGSSGDYAEMLIKLPRVDLARSEVYGFSTLF